MDRRKSNYLSKDHLKLLDKRLAFYESLRTGNRIPDTPAQKHFLAVVRGEALPQTPDEYAFTAYLWNPRTGDLKLKAYRESINAKPIAGTILPRAILPATSATNVRSSTPKKENTHSAAIAHSPTPKKENSHARFISETWGTRDAYRRDRSSWKRSR